MSMQQLMTKVKSQIPGKNIPIFLSKIQNSCSMTVLQYKIASSDEEATALLKKFTSMLDDIDLNASDFSAGKLFFYHRRVFSKNFVMECTKFITFRCFHN